MNSTLWHLRALTLRDSAGRRLALDIDRMRVVSVSEMTLLTSAERDGLIATDPRFDARGLVAGDYIWEAE